jgi:hypothetical protein
MSIRVRSGLAAGCFVGVLACAPLLAALPAAAATPTPTAAGQKTTSPTTAAPTTATPTTAAATTAAPSTAAPTTAAPTTAAPTTAGPATAAAAAAAASPFNCNRHLDDAVSGPALASPIALTPSSDSAQQIVNFGTDRTTKYVREVVMTADKPLPATLTAQQLNFDAVISRAGATLESTDFPAPTFSTPTISPDRQSITFEICLNPGSELAPGKYVGAVTLSGPAGLSAVSVSLTVNAKVAWLFYAWSAAALGAAFLLLVLKDAAAYRAKGVTVKTETTEKSLSWGESFLHPLSDPLWWATTVVALGTAFGALYATYAGNPAWGAGGFSDYATLIGAAFAAIGGHTIISALTPS